MINNENRLCYRYKLQTNRVDNKILIKKIPFKDEVIPIFKKFLYNFFCLINFNKIKESILISEFYWNSLTQDIKKFIINCPICKAEMNNKKIILHLKQIIPEGGHYRYLADIWYLPATIVENLVAIDSNEKYVLDCIVHTTKFMKSYGLKSQKGKEVLLC